MSFLRYLVAGLGARWGGFPRSDKVRVAVLGITLPIAAFLAWQTALPADALKSMRTLTDKRAFADETPGENRPASLKEKGRGQAISAPVEPSAKVTIESRASAHPLDTDAAVSEGHSVHRETSTVRGGASDDAGPFFQNGARGESDIARDTAVE
ncbi:MAG: hypothetical protein R6V12_15290 [Candidatus Hydrogenedentota bacterium]